ncbi:MAG: carbonic anhydrase [Mycobacterium sp.]|nr:carbonic anhydrase [Mycobacterium sp.]
MTTTQELTERNAAFVDSGFAADLTINPHGNMMVVGCVDPRVDPGHVLGLDNGEAAIIRNVGGRITPSTLRTMAMLSKVGQANAESRVPGTWNLVILHHTDCGMTDLAVFPDLLAEYFEVPIDDLEAKSVSDPNGSVRVDVDVILQALHASDFLVSGLVYDVGTGRVDVVVPPTPLRVG